MSATLKIISKYKTAIKDNYSILYSANKGVKAQVFEDIATISGIDRNELAERVFGVSYKTIKRYLKESKNLNPRNSELSLKLLHMFRKGIRVFGNKESFVRWINKPAYGIGDLIPINIINTSTGIDLIEDELFRIEYGATA